MGLRGMFGGGAEVDAVLHGNRVYPGGQVQGVVHVRGGKTDLSINGIELALTSRVEVQTDDGTRHVDEVYKKTLVSGPFTLGSGTAQQLPFAFELPWETPFNVVAGTPLPGVRVGLRTDLDIARALDKNDVDPLEVVALPSQEAILVGLGQLGFRLKGSDLERGRLAGSALNFHQEVEFAPSEEWRKQVRELEVRFVTTPQGLQVFLETDKRKMFARDRVDSFGIDHQTALVQNWPQLLRGHLTAIFSG